MVRWRRRSLVREDLKARRRQVYTNTRFALGSVGVVRARMLGSDELLERCAVALEQLGNAAKHHQRNDDRQDRSEGGCDGMTSWQLERSVHGSLFGLVVWSAKESRCLERTLAPVRCFSLEPNLSVA